MNVYEVSIKQGVAHVTANSVKHAERQAQALERDLQRRWTHARNQTEISPWVYVLGEAAKIKMGVS
jgi:hypothetical protein